MTAPITFLVLTILLIACSSPAAPAATRPTFLASPSAPSLTTEANPMQTNPTQPGSGGGTWLRLAASNAGPRARYDHTIILDPVKNRLVLFGGTGGGQLGDTWIFDLTTRAWREVKTSSAPSPRHGQAVIYDEPRRRMVLFGGQASGFFDDVWAFDLEKETWQEISVAGSKPIARYGLSAIFDAPRNRMIVSHGFSAEGRYDDTWAFDLIKNSWTDLTPSGTKPLKRCLHEAVYDAANDRMLLFGGCSSGFGPCPQGDLWSFDLKSNAWTELKPSGDKPSARSNPSLVFDGVSKRALLFGGKESESVVGDLWAFDSGSGKWLKLLPAGTALSARRSHDALVDAANHRVIIFGGTGDSGANDELWELILVR